MAKAAIKPGAAPAAPPLPPLPASPYAITFGDAPPAAAAFGGGRRGEHNPLKQAVLALPAPTGGKYPFFNVPVTVADTITDPQEREKALADALRKMVAKVSGITRRVSKADAATHFTVRSVREEAGAFVRVWRVEPKPAA